ncbi:MAG: hypothetical protein AABZ43_00185, partial [Planctomycetota bacterium]
MISSNINKFIKKLFSKSSQTLRDFGDFIAILTLKDNKSQSSQNTITVSLQKVCKSAIVNKFYGGIALFFSAILFLIMFGALCIHTLLRFPSGLVVFYIGSLIILIFVFLRILLLPLLSLMNKEKIALLIEQKYPSLNNSLI